MAKNKNDYFELIEQQVALCVQASEMLVEILDNFSAENISVDREKMHIIEHRADELHHDILGKLSAEFITPIDQEDILNLVQIIDDIVDAVDEVMLLFYMYNVKTNPECALDMAKIVDHCVKALYDASKELKNLKKPSILRKKLIEVNTVESEADEVYIEAIRKLFGTDIEIKTLIAHKEIYERMESCCDLCEYAADIIEQIIIKNT